MTSLKNTLMTAFLVGMAGITSAVAQTKNPTKEETAEKKAMEAKVAPNLLSKKYQLTEVTEVGRQIIAHYKAGNQTVKIEGEDTGNGRLDADEVTRKTLLIYTKKNVAAIELNYEGKAIIQAMSAYNGENKDNFVMEPEGIKKLEDQFKKKLEEPVVPDPLEINTHVPTKAESDARLQEIVEERKALFGIKDTLTKKPVSSQPKKKN